MQQDIESESAPVVDDAPEQKDETLASAESAPAPAEADTSEVAKSAAFGDWAEIGLITGSIERLSYTLQDYVFMALDDEETSAAEKLSTISNGLDDFKALILKVATSLVEDGNTEAVKTAFEAFKATSPEAVTKSLEDKDVRLTELTKSLADAEEQATDLQTRLEGVEAEKSLISTELEKVQARKAIVFDKFTGAETIESSDTDATVKEAQQKFASFITSGAARS